MFSPAGQSPSRVKGAWAGGGGMLNIMTVRVWAHFFLFRQERQTRVDNRPERVHPAGKEGGVLGAGPWGSRPWKIPFDPPYLWRTSFLCWPAGPFVAALPGTPQSKHSQACVLTAPLCCIRFSQQGEGQAGQALRGQYCSSEGRK